jgi:hypothetical protein
MTALGKKAFAVGMGLLSARWGKEFPPALSAIYAQRFKREQLTAEEFIVGVERAIEEDEFCPSAKRIVELARPVVAADARAGEVFERVLALRRYHPRFGSTLALDDVARELGESARHALVAIGGPRRVVNLTDDAFPFVLREFARAFAAFDADERARVGSGRLLRNGEGGLTAQPPVPFLAQSKRLAMPVAIEAVVKSLPLPRES